MDYRSTRNSKKSISSENAIAQGISEEGGLFLPESVPQLSSADIKELVSLDYIGRAKKILSLFLTDYTSEELDYCVKGAYTDTFDNNNPAPIKKVSENEYVLELWHGPTCAFKDLALQLLPYLLTVAVKNTNRPKTVILVATSGDTGKAALEGFSDVEGTDIIVFYPSEGVSDMQKLQMCTQKGENVSVCAIKGNFDDAQTGVKQIFTNPEMCRILKSKGYAFSSANSINWGRLVPQIVYYVSAYCDLLKEGTDLTNGFNVVVPTGNFGNILAAYYAKMMGVPIEKLICASNENNVLTDFINTGVYDKNRKFFTTISPSMDILVSSNLERLLYLLADCDDEVNKDMQLSLQKDGKFQLPENVLCKLKESFAANWCSDTETLETINEYYTKKGYLVDTHTAVALNVYNKYLNETGDNKPTVIASTASPYKFVPAVLSALGEDNQGESFELIERLENLTNTKAPKSLSELKTAAPRFNKVISKDEMKDTILDFLNI